MTTETEAPQVGDVKDLLIRWTGAIRRAPTAESEKLIETLLAPVRKNERKIEEERAKLDGMRSRQTEVAGELELAIKTTDIANPDQLEELALLKTKADLFPPTIKAQEERIEAFGPVLFESVCEAAREGKAIAARKLEKAKSELMAVLTKYCSEAQFNELIRTRRVEVVTRLETALAQLHGVITRRNALSKDKTITLEEAKQSVRMLDVYLRDSLKIEV